MKSCQRTDDAYQMLPVKHQINDNNPLTECRNLVQVLVEKTDVLYQECRHDRDKAPTIRKMGSILESLTILVDRLNRESGSCRTQEIHEDHQGFTYRAVRSCDLNRICDK